MKKCTKRNPNPPCIKNYKIGGPTKKKPNCCYKVSLNSKNQLIKKIKRKSKKHKSKCSKRNPIPPCNIDYSIKKNKFGEDCCYKAPKKKKLKTSSTDITVPKLIPIPNIKKKADLNKFKKFFSNIGQFWKFRGTYLYEYGWLVWLQKEHKNVCISNEVEPIIYYDADLRKINKYELLSRKKDIKYYTGDYNIPVEILAKDYEIVTKQDYIIENDYEKSIKLLNRIKRVINKLKNSNVYIIPYSKTKNLKKKNQHIWQCPLDEELYISPPQKKIKKGIIIKQKIWETIKRCKKENKNFLMIILSIHYGKKRNKGWHANGLVVDTFHKIVYRFEPLGINSPVYGNDYLGYDTNLLDSILKKEFNKKKFSYYGPNELQIKCPLGPQRLEKYSIKFKIKKKKVFGKERRIEAHGFCSAWSLMFIHLCILWGPTNLEEAKIIIDYMNKNPDELATMIRGYMSFIEKKKL